MVPAGSDRCLCDQHFVVSSRMVQIPGKKEIDLSSKLKQGFTSLKQLMATYPPTSRYVKMMFSYSAQVGVEKI